jgi:hypothetical protein
VVRLPPTAFPGLPKNLVRELKRRECTIPQVAGFNKKQNVIWGVLLQTPGSQRSALYTGGMATPERGLLSQPATGCASREDVLAPRVAEARRSLSITLDAYAASHRALQELKESGEILYQKMRVRSCAYLNHVVEPDHRRVKRRVNPMLRFKSFEKARVVIAGIELAQKISQRPYDLRRLGGAAASHAN